MTTLSKETAEAINRVHTEIHRIVEEQIEANMDMLNIYETRIEQLTSALQDLYDDWPGPDTEALSKARAALQTKRATGKICPVCNGIRDYYCPECDEYGQR